MPGLCVCVYVSVSSSILLGFPTGTLLSIWPSCSLLPIQSAFLCWLMRPYSSSHPGHGPGVVLDSSLTSNKYFNMTCKILHGLALSYSGNSSSSHSHPHSMHLPHWNICCCLNLQLLCTFAPTAPSARNALSLLLHSSSPPMGLHSGIVISRQATFAPPWVQVPSVDSHGSLYSFLVLHWSQSGIIFCIFACLPL